jgi:hypothetical protein
VSRGFPEFINYGTIVFERPFFHSQELFTSDQIGRGRHSKIVDWICRAICRGFSLQIDVEDPLILTFQLLINRPTDSMK